MRRPWWLVWGDSMLRPILALIVVMLVGIAGAAPLRADSDIIIRIDPARDQAEPADKPAAGKPLSLSFRELQVVSERPSAEVCFTFNLLLDRAPDIALENYVTVEPAVRVAATARDNVLCLEGFEHGRDYTVTLLAGLPGIGGTLDEAQSHAVRIEDMAPSLAFADGGVILPRLGNEGLPLRTVNLDKVHVAIARIHDRNLVDELRSDQFRSYWDYRTAAIVADGQGEWVWEGDLLVDGRRNAQVVTALPIDATIGDLKPGIYLATATGIGPDGDELRDESGYPRNPANQWFVVSDLGLTSFVGEDGALVQVRSLAGAQPLAGVEVALVSRNNKELARQASDAAGYVRFDPGLVRGRGGNAAAAIYAYGAEGEFSFIGLEGPALDLSNQDTGGRPVPGPLDAFLYTERGIYRPGETAHLTMLLRDDQARAVENLPLTVRLRRPDGVEADQRILEDQGGGSFALEIPLALTAMSGQWSVTAYAAADAAEADAVGSVYFVVEDFVPPRIEFDLSSAAARVEPEVEVPVEIDARYLYGAPAADLAGELAVVVRPAAHPYPDHDGYRFGLELDWDTTPVQLEPVAFRTGEDGKATAGFVLDALPDTTLPLEAVLRAAMFDIGGRPVRREITLPVVSRPFAIGLRPRFDNDVVDSDAVAGFDVIALDPDGRPIDQPGLTWELVKVFGEWSYYSDYSGRGRWQRIDRDSPRIAGGTLDLTASAPATVEAQVGWGSYRIEVFDLETGAASSVGFHAGWWGAADENDGAPDAVAITLDRDVYAPGDIAHAFVKPPFEADVAIATVGPGTRVLTSRHVGAAGAEIELPVPDDATAGFYVVANAFAPGARGADGAGQGALPRRAIGVHWLTVDPAGQRLEVTLELPEKLLPEQTVNVPVAVAGAAPGEAVFLTLAAVDDGVLQLTGFAAPDPLGYYLGKQRLGVDIRDLYGELIDPAGAVRGTVRSGGDGAADARQLANLPKRNTEVVSLFSGALRVGADGRADVPLDIPAFNGRLRLMAVAWSATRMGHAEQTVVVRAPVVAELSMPLYLAPGDRSDLVLSLHNLDGPAGDYRVALDAEGAVAVDGAPVGAAPVTLDSGAQWRAAVSLRALDPGEGRLHLAVTGPDGAAFARDWEIAVRPANPIDLRRLAAVLAPGQSLDLGWDVADGLSRATATVNLSVGSVPDFDAPGLVGALDRSHFRWTESIASSAVPLLYFGPEMVQQGLARAEDLDDRLQDAVDRLLGWQVARGSFATAWIYWDQRTEEWLTAYVLDFLTRADEQGARVTELGYRRGIRFLNRFISQDPGGEHGLAVQAYAYYVLARSGNMDAGRARRFFEARGRDLPTDLARAQIGAPQARLGDRQDAVAAFQAIDDDGLLSLVATGRRGSPYDYASPLRERAAVLTMMAESGVADPKRLTRMAAALARDVAATRRLSAQEMAWSLYLTHALAAFDRPVTLSVDGIAVTPDNVRTMPFVRRFSGSGAEGDRLASLRNDGDRPAYVSVSAIGNPTGALPAEENGFTISRRIVDRFGNPVDLGAVRQNDVLVVLIQGRGLDEDGGQITVADMLPAGFEIESAELTGGEEQGNYPWLPQQSQPQRAEAREDRFVALVDLPAYNWKYQGEFSLAYLVRAVTPGDYVLPGTYVEDMFRPSAFARGAAGRLRIVRE